jgi:hypothetical protein
MVAVLPLSCHQRPVLRVFTLYLVLLPARKKSETITLAPRVTLGGRLVSTAFRSPASYQGCARQPGRGRHNYRCQSAPSLTAL